MSAYVASLTSLDKFYLVCAVFGGGLFLVRMVLMLIGADQGDLDVDMDMDADIGMDMDDAGAADADEGGWDDGVDEGLKLLTIQGLTAFVMMFGLTGYSISRSSSLGAIFSLGLGAVAGFFGMWLVAKGFAVMRSLQSSGNINIYDAVGQDGTVYLTIPAGGVGKVQLTVGGRYRVMDAVTQETEAVKTGERVTVADVTGGNMLSVRRP